MRIVLLLLCWATLSATYYSPLQLNAMTIIFPKLLLLKKSPKSLLADGHIRFYILYEPEDRTVAEQIKARLKRLYPDTIEGYPFEATMLQYSQVNEATDASALLMLYSEKRMAQAAAFAQKHGIVTFAYDAADLDKGLLFALGIERSTIIYLNRDALSKYKIQFSDVLYQIVRFVDANATKGLSAE
jgi:hypothetical protein